MTMSKSSHGLLLSKESFDSKMTRQTHKGANSHSFSKSLLSKQAIGKILICFLMQFHGTSGASRVQPCPLKRTYTNTIKTLGTVCTRFEAGRFKKDTKTKDIFFKAQQTMIQFSEHEVYKKYIAKHGMDWLNLKTKIDCIVNALDYDIQVESNTGKHSITFGHPFPIANGPLNGRKFVWDKGLYCSNGDDGDEKSYAIAKNLDGVWGLITFDPVQCCSEDSDSSDKDSDYDFFNPPIACCDTAADNKFRDIHQRVDHNKHKYLADKELFGLSVFIEKAVRENSLPVVEYYIRDDETKAVHFREVKSKRSRRLSSYDADADALRFLGSKKRMRN